VKRGFKAEAERLASRLRREMGIASDTRLDVDKLARHLGIILQSADQLVPLAELERLDQLQPRCFSAATFHLPDGSIVAVTNPLNDSTARRDSDLAHELAHIILKHTPAQVDRLGDLTFFDCDPEQEEEANWLAGCLLLPRPLLLRAARQGLTPEQVAEINAVSVEMARFRLNTSGVYLQVKRTARQVHRAR
jgi:IrrE N-terminal-like domain